MLRVYWNHLGTFDYIIWAFGIILLLVQANIWFARSRRKLWATQGLKHRQQILLTFSELLPLLGLLGTVLALLETFQNMKPLSEGNIDITNIIQSFTPALTTTASGIIFLIPNLFINALLWWHIPDDLKEGV